MESEVADIPQAVNEKIEAEDRKLINETTNIVLDNLSKEETMDAEVIPKEHYEISNSTFEVENVKNNKEASAVAGEGENFLNLSSMAKVSDEENKSSPDAYEVIEKPDQSNKNVCKIQSLKDEKLNNRQEEIIATKETSLEEITQYAEELSSNLEKVADRGVVPVEDSADATSGLKVEYSIHAPDSEDVRIDTSIGETGAEKFGSGRNGKMEENFDVTLEKGSQETITFSEGTLDATENECEFQNPKKSESSFLEDTEDSVIQEGCKTTTAAEVSKVGDNSIQTSEKVEANSLKQVDESQIKHEECIQNESGKLSSTEAPTQDIDHEEIEAGDLGKAEISESERSPENYSPYEKPVESLHVAPEEIKTSASCQNAETISPSLEQRLCTNLSDETTDKTIDAADMKDVATIDPNEEPSGSIPYCSTNDLKVNHQLKEEKENDGPSIDAHHNPVKNSNICGKEGGDQINSLDDLDDSKAPHEVTKDQSKEAESQVDDDQKMTSKSDDIDTQMMDKEHDTTILSEVTADEPIKICQETTELEVTHSSENIEWKKDLNITHPLEEGKDNDGPPIDTPINNSNNICSKEGGDQINSPEDLVDSEASCEVTKDQIKETKTQVNDDQKMTSKPDDTKTQMMEREHDTTTLSEATADETIKINQEMNEDQKMTSNPDEIETKIMDREHDATIQSEATTDEPIRIYQETTELKVIHSSENIEQKKDLNITLPLEEGKINDGPSIDAPVNNSGNICNKGGGNQINSLEEGSHEVTEGRSKETETQVSDDQNMTLEREHDTNTQSKATANEMIKIGQEMNDDQKMTSKPDDIETQLMDREHDITIQSKATANEWIKICPKTTKLEDTFSSENMEKIIQLDENRNQHVYVASILEEKVAESFEGEKNITDIPSQEVEDSYLVDDELDNSTQTINADSGVKDNFTVLTTEKMETEVSFEQENEMNEPDSEDVATINLNEATGGSIPCYSANDLTATHPLEEGKDNDGPSIDAPVNDSNNKCSEGRGDRINGLKDQDYSEASCEATKYQGKETLSQVTDDHKMISEPDDIKIQRMVREQNTTIRSEATNDETIKICQEASDDQKMTSKSDDIEIQMMDKEHDITILSEATSDEPIKICQETTQLEITHSSENIEWKKDLNITYPLEEGKDNDGPSIDALVNNSNNICSKGEEDYQINSVEDPNDSEASREVTEDKIKETETQINDDQNMLSKLDATEALMTKKEHDTTTLLQATNDETIEIGQEMNDDQKMTSKPDDIETKMMDREHDTTIQPETTADEPIKIFQETAELEVIHSSENIKWKKDLNITYQLEGKDNDGPSIDAPVNNSSNICNKEGGGDQINKIEDPADSEGSREVTEAQSTKIETETQLNDDQNKISMLDDTETQMMEREHDTTTQSKAKADETIEIGKEVNEDQKMTSKPNDIETQMIDKEHDTTVQSETIADEAIEICQEAIELENTLSSESIEKIIQLDENKNQHVYVTSILEEKVAESFEGKKNITDMPSQEVEDSYPVDDGMDNSTQTINADSGAKDNFTVLTAEKTETEVSFEQENEMNEPDTEDVATTDLNEATGGSIPHYSANDLNPQEEGKDNDAPSIDILVNDSNNKCSEGIGDWINGLEEQDDSEASREVTEYQGKEIESQVTDDDKVTSEPDNIETQRMDKEQNTTIQSEATNDETIKNCQEVNDDPKMTSKPDDIETQIMGIEKDTTIQSEATADEAKIFHETTQIEVTHSSENIEKIIILDENWNQHVSVSSILEEKNAESFEGDEAITDIPSQQEGVSYQGHDGCIGNSAQIIKNSGANEILTVLSAEEMETGFLCEEEKKIKEPETEILEQRLRSQDTDLQLMMETDGFTGNFTETLEENSAKESSHDNEGSKESKNAKVELSTREVLNLATPSSVIEENKLDENLKIDERNVTISEQEIKNAEKKGTGENFEGTHFPEDNKVKTLEHKEEPNTTCTIQSSIQSMKEEMSSKDCLEFAQNLSSVSGISEGSREDIIGKTELAVTVGTEDPNLKEVEILDKVQLDENDLASEKLGMATSKPDKKEAESINIEAECETISNLGEKKDVNVSVTGDNEANETVTGETTKYEVENETQAALSNCDDQVAASGNVSQNTFNLNLEESDNPSYEEQNLLPVSCNETKNDNSENIEGSSIIPDSSSALKTSENINIEKAIVGQEGNARIADDFLKENLDTQKEALESKTEHENRMEDLDINSLNSMTEKVMQNLESVEPSKEPPSTSEPVIELKGNKSNPESTIAAVVDEGIKATQERTEPIGEVLLSQHSLDGTVDTNDDGREHGADGKQHFDSIQEVEKVYQNDKTTEQEEKVIEQDFESSQREASCEKKIQLGADDTINRTPDCDQIITGGSLSEEILQVQQKNENADSEGKIKERIEEEGCHEDVQMIAVADAAPHEEKGLDSSSIKNLLSDDSKETITQDIAEVPEDEKLVNITSLASIARKENCEYKVVHELTSFQDKTDTEDLQVLDDSITFSLTENPVQVDPEESTELLVPCGQKEEPMLQDPITVLEEIEEQPQNACEAGYQEKMTLDIDEDLNLKQEEFSVTKESEDEKLANTTSLVSVATEENSDYKVVHELGSFHDKTDTEVVKVLYDSITFSLKDNRVPVDPEESVELQVLCGEKVKSLQQVPITFLEEIEEEQPLSTSEAVSKEKMTLDIDEDLNRKKEELSVTKESEYEKFANITSLASVATEENSDHKIVPEPSSFHDKTDAEDVQVLDDVTTISLKENIVQVDPEQSTELQVPHGEKMKSMQQTVLEEIGEEQLQNTFEAVIKENVTLDIHENLNQELEELSDTKVSEDEKLINITKLASEATEENGDYKFVPETSSFHNKTDVEDVQVLDDAITISSKENIQIDPKESTELQVPHGEKVESMQQDPITVLEKIEEQPQSTSETISKEKNTLDIIEDLNQEQEESSATEVPEDKKLADVTSLASVATEENSDCKIVNEPNSFQDKNDTEDVKVLDDFVAFSTGSLVQVDPRENTELQVPCGEKVEAIRQDPTTVLEEIEEQQPKNASEAVSEAKGVIYEGVERTTDNCEEIMDSSSVVELDEISPYNSLQESRKETLQMGEDKGTEQQDDLHTLAHAKESPMEIVRKDAQLYVTKADGSEDTGVMEKLVATSLLALDENMVEEAEFKESEFAENSTTNKNIQQLKQEETLETFLADGKNMKPAGEPQEVKCGQEKVTVGVTMQSRKESTSLEIAKSSPAEFLQIYFVDTSHAEDHSTKEKELYAENVEPIEDERTKSQEDKDEEEEACNQKECVVDVAIHEEKGLDSSSIKNLVETNLDDCKDNITRDISDNLNREQEELSLTTMSEDEKPVNTISLASKSTEENSESNSFHEKTDSKDLQVLEDSITCSNKENIVQVYPKESTDQDPSGEKVELMQQDSVTVLQEREKQQTGNASETVSEAKGVNFEGGKRITDYCEERVASPSFVVIDDISHSNPLLESRMEILALDKNVVHEANYEETSHVEDHYKEELLHEEKTEPIEDKEAKAQEDEAGKSKRSDFGSQTLTLVEERDKDAIASASEVPYEDLKVEGEANKFTNKADTTPSTVMKKEMSVEEICENEKSTNSHDEIPEITNATSDDVEGQEVESARVIETAASVPQSETIEAQHADIVIAVLEQSESGEVEIADEENKSGAAYKSNDQNIEELISSEFPTLTENNAENSEKETDKDYEKGFETKCARAEAVIVDNITCDQVKEELPEKPLELLSKVQLFGNKIQSTDNNDHGANEEGIECGEETSKDEDSSSNSTKKEEVDNVVDSNVEILQPDKLEKVPESETQVRSFEVITKGGQKKTEEENLKAAKEEIRNGEIVTEEICEAKESKINISSEQTKDEAEVVEDCPLGSPEEEIIPERYQEGEEKPEEYLEVKAEEAVKSATEKVFANFEEAFVNENVSEHIVFDNMAVEEPKESIVGIFQVKEEGKIAEGIATIVNNQEKAHKLDDAHVETEREVLSEEVKISGVALLEHGEDRTGANEDTGLQNKNINFSPKGDAGAGELLDNENIISEPVCTKLIRETIEDNKETIMQERENIERKDEKLSISESLGDGEIEERQNKNQHEYETDKQLNDEVCISNRVQEKDEEQVVLSGGEGEVIVREAASCSRQIKDGNEEPDFSSHSKDPSEISHIDGALGIAKDNENSTDLRMLEKIFTGTTESEISELTCPNESEETITSTGSKDIQSMEQISEAITVDTEMHESNAGTASSDVQEATGVKSREEEKAKDDHKNMTETSTSMACAISTSKIKQGSAVETLVVVEDQETEDKLFELHHLPHLHHIQDSEGKTEEDGPVDLPRASNITEDVQELDERSIALSNKENLAKTDPTESKEHEVSSQGKGLELIQQDPVPATFQQEIENQQPRNSSEAVSEAKDAICEEEKVTITNCNEFTEKNSCMTSDKVSRSNMLLGSASEAAQGTKDKNTPTQCHKLPLSSDIKYSDMERTQMDVESWVERVDDINVTNVMQNLDAASVPASDKPTVIDAYHTKNVEFFNSTVDNKCMPQLQQDTAEIFHAEGKIPKPSELEQEERTADETLESTKQCVSTEIAKASLPDILQVSLKESSEMADHHTKGREPTVQKEELKAEKTEEAEHEEEKSDEEKDNLEKSSEQKGSNLGFEAPVLVGAGDVVTKVSHKKSHNILSGVGSKVKHSIAKVKKAIIGKSSHPKPPSPKERKKC